MSKSIALLSTVIVLVSNISFSAAQAKSSYEYQNEADHLDAKAANRQAKSTLEENQSSLAIDEGKRDKAAHYAKRAAREQKRANKLEDKADEKQAKADKKAIHEMR